jgi:BirA family biotin operon repressor/biotin-[acetyl-CoA-carboxylase] ligase
MSSRGATPQRAWPAGWHVDVVDETGSTNDDLVAAAVRGAPDRTVLVARHQTSGRGRLDRRWDAPPGANLLVSMLIREVPDHLHQATQRVALAAREAVASVAGVAAELKWPNDLLVDGRKLAGVLAQAGGSAHGGRPTFVVVGIGVNVGWAPQGAARLGDGLDPLDILSTLLNSYDALPADVTGPYRAALVTIGQRVRVERPGGLLEGRATDVEADGRLVVIDDCAITHRIDTGDVIHLRPGASSP